MDGKRSSRHTIWSRLIRGEENEDQVDQLLAQFYDENSLQLNLNSISHRSKQQLQSSPNSSSQGLGGFDYAGLDDELTKRYAKLKAPRPAKSNKPQEISDKEISRGNNDLEEGPKEDSRGNSDIDKGQKEDSGGNSDIDKGPNLAGAGENVRVLADEDEERILGQDLAARFAALKTNSSRGRVFDSLGIHKEEMSSDVDQVQRLLASAEDSIRLEKRKPVVSDSFKQEEEEIVSDSEVDKVVEWAKDAVRLGLVDSEEEIGEEGENSGDSSDIDAEEEMQDNKRRNARK